MANNKIIIATHNMGKAKEFKALFDEFGLSIKTLHDYPSIPEIEETGNSFKENALQKAEYLSKRLNKVVLADDSGLIVDALNGAPGIFSARYAGELSNDEKNNDKLLRELKEIPEDERNAHFHCSLVVVGPDRAPLHVYGEISGKILETPRGTNGFGYDPLFYIPELNQTMAELSNEEKNKISHRAQAIDQLKLYLKDWL